MNAMLTTVSVLGGGLGAAGLWANWRLWHEQRRWTRLRVSLPADVELLGRVYWSSRGRRREVLAYRHDGVLRVATPGPDRALNPAEQAVCTRWLEAEAMVPEPRQPVVGG